jgi:hypothetical protein
MEALIYITKSALLLSLFFAAYEFLLKKETFFSQNRIFLLVGLTTAAVLPSVVFKQTHWIEAASVSTTAIHGISQTGIAENPSAIEPAYWESFSLWDGLLFVYLAGVIFFLIKFFIQLFNLFLLLKNETNSFYESGIKFIETNQKTGAFSFFKTVVFNPKFYSQDELSLILKHEKAHAANYHNIDIILAKLTQIMFWFNPLAWLYRKRICQNLEFLADREATKNLECSKNYQLSLVNASLETSTELPISNFHSSFIKTRILMLHKEKSNLTTGLKAFLILPFLALFLFGFQIKTIAQVKQNQQEPTNSEITKNLEEDGFFIFNGERIDLKNADEDYYEIKSVELIEKNKNAVVAITGSILDSLIFTNYNSKILGVKGRKNFALYQKANSNTNFPALPKLPASTFFYTITAETTDAKLASIKKELFERHIISFDLGSVKRNSEGKITDIKLVYAEKKDKENGVMEVKGKSSGIEPINISAKKIWLGSNIIIPIEKPNKSIKKAKKEIAKAKIQLKKARKQVKDSRQKIKNTKKNLEKINIDLIKN